MTDILKNLIGLRDHYDRALEKARIAEKEADQKHYYNERQKELTKIIVFNDIINNLDRIIKDEQHRIECEEDDRK